MSTTETLPAPELPVGASVDGKWEQERRAFVHMLPDLLITHRDQHVAVHQGQVVASGADKTSVALQAYREYGQIPIYVGLVSDQLPLPARLPSPRTLKY